MFPPRRNRVPVLVVVGAGLLAGAALPALRVFAVTFAALVGAMVTLG
jgi:hypothetical protein